MYRCYNRQTRSKTSSGCGATRHILKSCSEDSLNPESPRWKTSLNGVYNGPYFLNVNVLIKRTWKLKLGFINCPSCLTGARGGNRVPYKLRRDGTITIPHTSFWIYFITKSCKQSKKSDYDFPDLWLIDKRSLQASCS